jgi:AraC family transcriptional regulator of adaptative response/methylated-DNA-[protein]-cysteine methyltransferase
MNHQQHLDYDRIANAIVYIRDNFKAQPSLEQIAEAVHLSPFHFQRLFTDWAGISPKKFIQYSSVEYAKHLLREKNTSLFETALETGLSGTGRLHDLFIKIEGMTPGEYKNGGEDLLINYSFAQTRFGELLAASTSKGICHMAFYTDASKALSELKARFPMAVYRQSDDENQQQALSFFQNDGSAQKPIKLHLNGTPFQLKVWETLLKIPMGNLATYGTIAGELNNPKAYRAVGTAIGSNPVAFLIPCHRVIQASGNTGGYRWGTTRKTALIAWEAAKVNQ